MENKTELNSELLKKMFNGIRHAEIRNINTQKRDDKGMIKIIEEYIDKTIREEMNSHENKEY